MAKLLLRAVGANGSLRRLYQGRGSASRLQRWGGQRGLLGHISKGGLCPAETRIASLSRNGYYPLNPWHTVLIMYQLMTN